MTRQEVRTIFQKLASKALSPLLAQFIDEADLSDAEIRELKRRLDEKRSQAAAKRSEKEPR
jgi:predicted transcriptional regulator